MPDDESLLAPHNRPRARARLLITQKSPEAAHLKACRIDADRQVMAERDDLMAEIISMLDMPKVSKGVGSSVYGDFVTPLTRAVGLQPGNYPNKYRRIEAVLRRLGESYDPRSDTSEAAQSGGGGTITNAGLRKVRRALHRLSPEARAALAQAGTRRA